MKQAVYGMLLVISMTIYGEEAKVGIYSGTFDPPTRAHDHIIRTTIQDLNLDKLYIFVNKNGTKTYKCSIQQRVAMLERMLADIKDKVVIVDQSSDKKYHDYLMLKKIIAQPVINITGQDSYERRLYIQEEYRINFDKIAIIPRAGTQTDINLEPNAFFLSIDNQVVDGISSTKVRQKLSEKNYEVPLHPNVLSYIIEHSLYQSRPTNKNLFEEAYYAYLGRQTKPVLPPFDPQASKEAWQDNFYKWFNDSKGKA